MRIAFGTLRQIFYETKDDLRVVKVKRSSSFRRACSATDWMVIDAMVSKLQMESCLSVSPSAEQLQLQDEQHNSTQSALSRDEAEQELEAGAIDIISSDSDTDLLEDGDRAQHLSEQGVTTMPPLEDLAKLYISTRLSDDHIRVAEELMGVYEKSGECDSILVPISDSDDSLDVPLDPCSKRRTPTHILSFSLHTRTCSFLCSAFTYLINV